jgi:RimJ/RimL family protein N-acetyltransferase
VQIETERLLLRDFTLDDVEALAACRADERLWRFYNPVDDIEANTRGAIEVFIRWQSQQPRTYFQLAIVLKQTGSLVGTCGLRKRAQAFHRPPVVPEAELGYELEPRHWGKGYASEAARAMVAYGFGALELDRVFAYPLGENEVSWRLMERLGMRREGVLRDQANLRGRRVDTYLYGLLKEEWKSQP